MKFLKVHHTQRKMYIYFAHNKYFLNTVLS